MTTLKNGAFYDCSSLDSIFIPSSVTNIMCGAFGGCASLKTINVDPKNTYYIFESGILYNKEKTILYSYPSANGNVTIPSNVTSILRDAFRECKKLTSITSPNTIKYVPPYTFDYCNNLSSVHLSSNTTRTYNNAFLFCESLSSITIPAKVDTIDSEAFDGCLG